MARSARIAERHRWYDHVVVERVLRNWVADRPCSTDVGRSLTDAERRVVLDVMMSVGLPRNRAMLALQINTATARRVLSSSVRHGGAHPRRVAAATRYLRGIGEQALHEAASSVLTSKQYASIIGAAKGAPEIWEITTHAILTGAAGSPYAYTGN
jgi:hypothetical protein